MELKSPKKKLQQHSVILVSILKSILKYSVMLKFKYLPINTAIRFT